MISSRLTFGEMTVLGELARGVHPADEMGLAMALALGQPDPPAPPFAVVPVLLDGHEIGTLSRNDFVCGVRCYGFQSTSGNTNFYCLSAEEVVRSLSGMLQLAG